MKIKKVVIGAIMLVLILVSNNIIVNRAATTKGDKLQATVYNYKYEFYSGVTSEKGKVWSTVYVYPTNVSSAPAGYMGSKAKLYNSDGKLVKESIWRYNPQSAISVEHNTSSVDVDGSIYYGRGEVQFYNGNGYNTYTCLKTPYVNSVYYNTNFINKNCKGEIYGSEIALEKYGIQPDLIAAIGDNEIHGYVYAEDLVGFVPNTPEEAIAYQNSHQGISRVINVYDCEGEIVLDTFTIDNTDVDENIYFE